MSNAHANLHAVLREQVGESEVELSRWQSAVVTQDQIFEAFRRSNLDYKGALCSGFSSEGFKTTSRVSIDFGTLCPGVTAGLKVSLSGSTMDSSLLVVARQPKQLGALGTTERPVSFACMRGVSGGYQFKLEGEVGAKTPDVPGTDCLQAAAIEITLQAKLTAKASIDVTGERMFVRDPAVRFYSGATDPMLATDFNMLIGPGAKADIKADIVEFFDKHPKIKHLAPKKDLRRRITGGGIPRAQLDAALKEAITFVHKPKPITGLTREEREFLVNNLEYRRAVLRAYEGYDLEYFLGVRLEHERSDARRGMAQANTARGLGRTTDQVNESTEVVLKRNAKLCFLDLCSNQCAASAGLEASMEASISTGYKQEVEDGTGTVTIGQETEDDDPDVSLKVGAEVGAKVGIKGSYKRTSYRYQTYIRGENPVDVLVTTQDTIITYKQVKLGGSVSGSIGVEASVLGRSRGAKKEGKKSKAHHLYNAMSYESAVLCWTVPRHTAREVRAETGSGYAFGESQMVQTLTRHYDGYTKNGKARGVWQDPDATSKAYLDKLAAALRVSTVDLVEMIGGCRNTMTALATSRATNPGGGHFPILLESIFPIPGEGGALAIPVTHDWEGSYSVRVATDSDAPHGGFRKIMRKKFAVETGRPELQAIRLRVRRADTKSNTDVKFKLGFNLNGTGLGIELAKIEKAGCETVVDVYTKWFGAYSAYNRRDTELEALRAMGHENAVPPVALLHQ